MIPASTLPDDSPPASRERWPGAAELWHRYHAAGPGDASEEELVKQYLPLVKSVVARLAITLPPVIELEELHSAGMVGLLRAVRSFDPHNGAPFESYARLRIRGSVIDELRRMDWAPRSVHGKARRIQQAMETVEQRHGRFATDDEVAAELGIPLEEYRRWLDDVRPATFVCLDAAHQELDEEESTHHEVVSDPTQDDAMEVAVRTERARLIAERLQQLPDLHRKVIALYYYEGLRLREIAAAAGLCESRICQVHAQAILAIKSYLEACEALPVKR